MVLKKFGGKNDLFEKKSQKVENKLPRFLKP
jgi:hypothetical protein